MSGYKRQWTDVKAGDMHDAADGPHRHAHAQTDGPGGYSGGPAPAPGPGCRCAAVLLSRPNLPSRSHTRLTPTGHSGSEPSDRGQCAVGCQPWRRNDPSSGKYYTKPTRPVERQRKRDRGDNVGEVHERTKKCRHMTAHGASVGHVHRRTRPPSLNCKQTSRPPSARVDRRLSYLSGRAVRPLG